MKFQRKPNQKPTNTFPNIHRDRTVYLDRLDTIKNSEIDAFFAKLRHGGDDNDKSNRKNAEKGR